MGGGGWFRGIWNTVCFHTHHHCYLRYFLLKDTLQTRMVEHGLSTEVFFFRQFDSALASFARESELECEKKKELFSLFPHPNPPSKKSLAVFISIRALDNI